MTLIDMTRLDTVERLHLQRELDGRLRQATYLDEAAQAACAFLHEALVVPDTVPPARGCALVRCFKSHPFGLLAPELQRHARAHLPPEEAADAAMPCLSLVASAGDEPWWQSPGTSRRRRCLPLHSAEAIERTPMWARFFREAGVDIDALCRPRSPAFVDPTPHAVDIFCVEDAVGSPSLPDQAEFVVPYGIRSAFGFCGQLRRGDLCVLVLFSRVRVSRTLAARLRPVALDLATRLFAFEEDRVFRPASNAP